MSVVLSLHRFSKPQNECIVEAEVKVGRRIGSVFCSRESLFPVMCRICKTMNRAPCVTDRRNSCVVCALDKRLLMMRHVGDSVSMATVCEKKM